MPFTAYLNEFKGIGDHRFWAPKILSHLQCLSSMVILSMTADQTVVFGLESRSSLFFVLFSEFPRSQMANVTARHNILSLLICLVVNAVQSENNLQVVDRKPTAEWQLSPRRSDYVISYVGRNGRAMSYGTIQPYLDSRKHLKLQTGHTVTVIALHGQRIQISCSVVNLTSSGSYLEFREKDGDIAKQPVINRVYTSKSNTMAVYSQIVKDADWFNCKWKTTDSYPIHKLCHDTEAKTINGAIQSMDLAEESHRFCTFSIVVPLDQHVQISCSVVSLASGCGLKFHEERGWMNEAGLISTRPIIDRNYTSKGNKMVIQADSFDNKRCRFDCTWKTTTTPTYRLCFDKRAKSPNGTIQPLDDAGMDGPRFCPFTITAARTDQLIRISCSVVKLTTVLSSLRFYDGRDAGANVIAYPPIANKVYTSKGNTLVVFSWKFDDDWFDCEWATVQASS